MIMLEVMINMKRCILLCAIVFSTYAVIPIYGVGEPLVFPPVIESSNGILNITLSIRYADWSQTGTGFALRNTRLLDGLLPGKTVIVSPGDTLRILFKNELELQTGSFVVNSGTNVLGYPDHANLHFHGGHVSGELPSDDIRMKVDPQSSYQYETVFPSNHMGGTHWIHPHVHGSSALHVGGGAVAAMIVRDTENDQLPIQVSSATEVLLVIQDIHPEELDYVRLSAGDEKLKIEQQEVNSKVQLPDRWRIVNGQYQPYYEIEAGDWYRFRIVNAGWLEEALNLSINDNNNNCEMVLLAKDGVYIRDFPRPIQSAPIPTGGRADIMVRCKKPGTHSLIDFQSQTVMELRVISVPIANDLMVAVDDPLPRWNPPYPDYLRDLRKEVIKPGCNCETQIKRCNREYSGGYGREYFCVNGLLFEEETYIHSIPFGSVVERTLLGMRKHPYHQHVYPFQLISELDGIQGHDERYFQPGDWHDVWTSKSGDGPQVIRFKPDVHLGRLMVHCHVLSHEDEGTMTQEYVGEPSNTTCDCTPRDMTGEKVAPFEERPGSAANPQMNLGLVMTTIAMMTFFFCIVV